MGVVDIYHNHAPGTTVPGQILFHHFDYTLGGASCRARCNAQVMDASTCCQHAGQLWLPLSRGQRILKPLHFVKSSKQDYKVNAVPLFRPFVVWCGYTLEKGSSENWTGEVSA